MTTDESARASVRRRSTNDDVEAVTADLSVVATPYAIRVVLSHDLTPDAFYDIAYEMANGIWDRQD